MAMTISGDGTITGLAAGGLPDASVTPDELTQKLTLDTAKAASGTAVDFTGIPSWVKRITVMLNAVSTNGASEKQIQLGDSGGLETTGYVGSRSILLQGSTVSTVNLSAGFLLGGTSAADVIHGTYVITLIGSNAWAVSGSGAFSTAQANFVCVGNKTLSDTLDRLRLTTVNGTDAFDAGSVNILYE